MKMLHSLPAPNFTKMLPHRMSSFTLVHTSIQSFISVTLNEINFFASVGERHNICFFLTAHHYKCGS